jgi:hypothetical protein
METVSATLSIEVHVNCPHCEEWIDLMSEDDTNGYNHNEEGNVITQACPTGHWTEEHKTFSVKDVTCCECKESFNVEGLEW